MGLAPPSSLADYMHSISAQCPSVQRGSLGVGRAGGRTAVEWQLRGIGPLASDPDVCLRRHLTQKHDGPLSQRASVCGEPGLSCREGLWGVPGRGGETCLSQGIKKQPHPRQSQVFRNLGFASKLENLGLVSWDSLHQPLGLLS